MSVTKVEFKKVSAGNYDVVVNGEVVDHISYMDEAGFSTSWQWVTTDDVYPTLKSAKEAFIEFFERKGA
jgi:hypothetical protein